MMQYHYPSSQRWFFNNRPMTSNKLLRFNGLRFNLVFKKRCLKMISREEKEKKKKPKWKHFYFKLLRIRSSWNWSFKSIVSCNFFFALSILSISMLTKCSIPTSNMFNNSNIITKMFHRCEWDGKSEMEKVVIHQRIVRWIEARLLEHSIGNVWRQ